MRFSRGRNIFIAFMLAVPIGLAVAESPAPPKREERKKEAKATKTHPNLAAAQKLVAQAFDKLEAAQEANEYDLGGHAAKAKALLLQAKAEIDAAAAKAGDDKSKPKR